MPFGLNIGLIVCLAIETIILLGMRASMDDKNKTIWHLRRKVTDTEESASSRVAAARTKQRQAEQKLAAYKAEMKQIIKYDPVVEECSEELLAWIKEEEQALEK